MSLRFSPFPLSWKILLSVIPFHSSLSMVPPSPAILAWTLPSALTKMLMAIVIEFFLYVREHSNHHFYVNQATNSLTFILQETEAESGQVMHQGANVKPLLVMTPASHSRVPVQLPAALPPIQAPVYAPGKTVEGGPGTWDPITQVVDPDGAPGS